MIDKTVNAAADEQSPQHWSNLREAGTARGMLFLVWINKTFGREIFSIVLYPVTAYFFVFKPVARRASLEFLKTHAQVYPDYWAHKPGYRDVLLHFYAFGQSVLDKTLAWGSPIDEKEFESAHEEKLAELLQREEGRLIIGSHLGNLEYCRGFVQRYKQRTINALVYDQHAANFVNVMQRLYPASRINIFQVDELDVAMILRLRARIEAGEWIFIAGDRVPVTGGVRTVPVTFMKREAQLPIGPYVLAKVLQCNVELMFSYRRGKKVYFSFLHFSDCVSIPRQNSQAIFQAYAQQYATALEEETAKAPLQWFNFYPFWEDAKSTGLAPQPQEKNYD